VQVKQVFIPLIDTVMTKGHGSGMMPADLPAADVVKGLLLSETDISNGKVKALRITHRIAPGLTAKIIKVSWK